MEQKRVYRRIKDFVKVEFTAKISGEITGVQTQTQDISAGGVKVYLNQSVEPKTKMFLKITLPSGYNQKTINAESEVIQSDLIGVVGDRGEEMIYETRFKFTKIKLEEKNSITRYVYDCRKKKLKAEFDIE